MVQYKNMKRKQLLLSDILSVKSSLVCSVPDLNWSSFFAMPCPTEYFNLVLI